MIRVLHVINWFHQGGLETQTLNILRNYDRARFHMDACVIGSHMGPLAREALDYGADVISCPKSPNLWSFSKRFARTIKGRNYSVVHANGEAWSGALARGAAMSGVPVRIAHMRDMGHVGFDVGKNRALKAAGKFVITWGRYWVKKYATHVMSVSRAALDERWPEWRNGSGRFFVWTGGVDTERFSRPAGSAAARGEPVIVSVGNFALKSKRQDLALRIFKEVRRTIPTSRLIFVGGGPTEPLCKDLAREIGVEEAVEFLGQRDRKDVPNLLRSASVFLSCSESEGLPNVLLEAQSAGVPVVATDIDAHREVLAPAVHPYLFGKGEVTQGSGNVMKILTDPSLANRLGEIETAHVKDFYEARLRLGRLENLYEAWTDGARHNR
jgi:glycosyltransferase involved in cell wall biosynthesis